ncbi:MAG: glutathione S-transferase family protein [Burkholderiales bacterium]|nr:glutathione S-transferase family protein [Burkholderiales bacterium]
MRLRLAIANKNYSSWSMRPWVLLTQAGIEFEEIQLAFEDDGSVRDIARWSPTGKVPVLWVDEEPVWDSLAICETAAELFPEKSLWPADAATRRHARAVSAEMHAGFGELRRNMPMNIRASHPDKGRTPGSLADIARVAAVWETCRSRHGEGGDMLFGRFSCADAMFAPVAMRFMTYAVTLPPVAQAYCEALQRLPAVQRWCQQARAETGFVPADEPYASV